MKKFREALAITGLLLTGVAIVASVFAPHSRVHNPLALVTSVAEWLFILGMITSLINKISLLTEPRQDRFWLSMGAIYLLLVGGAMVLLTNRILMYPWQLPFEGGGVWAPAACVLLVSDLLEAAIVPPRSPTC